MSKTEPEPSNTGRRRPESSASAILVGSGIFLSRIAGLIRDRIFAHFFGNSAAADAFKAAFRIPNFLQNLFGEGTLSASFIPVYARLLAEEDKETADRVAGAIAAILTLSVSLLVLGGVLLTPYLISVIAPGFTGEKRELTIRLVRILFPGAGALVMSAWCLGILNSHRRFFLPYAAPVVWNLVLIATLLQFGPGKAQFPLAEILAWFSVLGSIVQFLVQLPLVLRLASGVRLKLDFKLQQVRTIIRNFVPVFFGRGVIQISAYVDELLASLLPTGAFAALSYAQTLYLLPVSLFGMSVSAAELPAMSSATGDEQEIAHQLRTRLDRGLQRIAFFIVPSSMAFLALGDVIAAAIYQTGQFTHDDAVYVWAILAGATVGLLASTMGRLYASAFYALQDTRTPMRYAIVRVLLTAGLGYLFALHLPGWLQIAARWGVAGLTASAGIAGWIEFALLRRALNRRVGRTGLKFSYMARLWSAALVAGAAGFWLKSTCEHWHPILKAIPVLGGYAALYVLLSYMLKIDQVHGLLRRISR